MVTRDRMNKKEIEERISFLKKRLGKDLDEVIKLKKQLPLKKV